MNSVHADITVNINGEISPGDRARISVMDRGFLYGDSVYEVMRVYNKRPFALRPHLLRLSASARGLGFQIPNGIESEILRTIQSVAGTELYVRVVVTRGEGPMALRIDPNLVPNWVIWVRPVQPPARDLYENGCSLATVSVRRNSPDAIDPSIKSGNYLNNILAQKEANDRGAYEAVMLDHAGCIAEGASSNVFVVHGGVLKTPPLATGILEGITRRVVLELAAEVGIPVEETSLRPEDLHRADEVFITSSIREIVPVSRVDDADLPRVWVVVGALRRAFDARVASECRGLDIRVPT